MKFVTTQPLVTKLRLRHGIEPEAPASAGSMKLELRMMPRSQAGAWERDGEAE